MSALRAVLLAGVVAMSAAVPASAGAGGGNRAPRLGLALVGEHEVGRPWIAQRTIERAWTVAGDSGVVRFRPEGAPSEIGALALSAIAPGAGQAYLGRRTALAYAAVEMAGWIGWALLKKRADDLRDEAARVAGTPEDPASAWSFERWEEATAEDPGPLRELYAGDREAFFDAIASDPRYASGWTGGAERDRFGGLLGRSDRREEWARYSGWALWMNHVVAAADALRGARLRGLSLGGDVGIDVGGRWLAGGPGPVMALERRF